MHVGMAVNTGNDDKKKALAADLENLTDKALELGLWVDGHPFDVYLRAVASSLLRSTTESMRQRHMGERTA